MSTSKCIFRSTTPTRERLASAPILSPRQRCLRKESKSMLFPWAPGSTLTGVDACFGLGMQFSYLLLQNKSSQDWWFGSVMSFSPTLLPFHEAVDQPKVPLLVLLQAGHVTVFGWKAGWMEGPTWAFRWFGSCCWPASGSWFSLWPLILR